MNDKQIIKKFGGPSKLAKYLGFGVGGVQRVHNWTKRGIPSDIKLKHPELNVKPKAANE